jgi:hypothetical protein
MKRYLLFIGDTYYPGGGWKDFIGSFETVSEALIELAEPRSKYDWFQIVDLTKEEIVQQAGRNTP